MCQSFVCQSLTYHCSCHEHISSPRSVANIDVTYSSPWSFSLKISNTVDVPFRLTVKPAMTLKFIRTVLGKTENELPDDSISELHFSIRPYATQNIRFPCLGNSFKISKSSDSKIPFSSWIWTFSEY